MANELEPKDPHAVVDYTINWARHLVADTISTSTWTVPSGITKDSDSKTSQTTTVWLSGGTDRQKYSLVNRIVTAAGRTLDQTIKISVRER